MRFRSTPILLTLLPLIFNQSAAIAYDQNAQQQIMQIQQQLQQQFPQQIQQSSSAGAAATQSNPGIGMSQTPDAQQRILQINQQLQQMTQGQQQPSGMTQSSQWQQGQMPQGQMQQGQMQPGQMQHAQMRQGRQPQQFLQGQAATNNFTPSNSQSLSLPVLNSTIAGYTSVNDVIPNQVGATSGVDILDESLKYHTQSSGQAYSQQTGAMLNQNFTDGAGLNNNNSNCNHATVFSGGGQQNCCQHSNPVNNAADSANGGQISTRAIGAIGAAALVGTFLGNGGVGGMIKSVGWDNNRHIRGMSIGGY